MRVDGRASFRNSYSQVNGSIPLLSYFKESLVPDKVLMNKKLDLLKRSGSVIS
jgi:hypothetical protein